MGNWELAGAVILAAVWSISSIRSTRKWEAEVDLHFQAALKDLNIEHYDLLVDRTVAPSSKTYAEVYRILADQDGRYFLYMLLDEAEFVMKPLTKERALIAAQMSGYAK